MEAKRIHPDVLRLASLLVPSWFETDRALRLSGTPLNDGPSGIEAIREMAGRVNALTSEELSQLREAVLGEAERVDGEAVTPESVALLNELAEIGESVMAESSAREAAQAQAEADAETARQRIAAVSGEAAEGSDEETPPAEGEEEETPPAEGEEETPAETPESVAASAATVAEMAARRRSSTPAPSPEAEQPEPNRAVLTATGALRGIAAGETVEDRMSLARGVAETLRRMPKDGKSRGDVIVASATWQYPEDRQLGEDPTVNAERMDAVIHPTALVATGGICAPVNVDYAIPTWATAERPLRDGLPSFQATRGGIRFVQPPDIGDLAAATGIWTEATDADPGDSTKAILRVDCGDEEQVLVDAVTTRLGFGNMQARFAPEQVAANTDLAIAAAARIAENNLLAQIEAASIQNVTSAVVLGATRDFITTLEQAVSAYRWVHRLSPATKFTAILPEWLRSIIKVDLARELAHDNSGNFNVLAITDAQVDSLLDAHGINPIWHIDGQPQDGSNYPLQGWTAQTAAALKPFPTKVAWYLFPEGTIQFLDGGRLDLGVVRDSTLDATNDYETFVETFEAIAFRGFSGGALQLVSTLCANGGSAGTISTAGACA